MLVAALSVLVFAAPARAGTDFITADPCVATFIGVRGTGEAAGSGTMHNGRVYQVGGLGTRLVPLTLGFSSDPDIPVFMEQLVYPASAFPAWGTSNQLYTNSVNTGATNLAAEIEYIASICPHTNILLAGYSQGAQVIGNVLAGSPALSAAARARVTAVTLFADPSYNFGEKWDYNYQLLGQGVFHRTPGAFSSWTRQGWLPGDTAPSQQTIVRSYCLANDMWCQGNAGGADVHANGYTSAVVSPGWTFMRNWMIDYE